jgi:hypothetical protein
MLRLTLSLATTVAILGTFVSSARAFDWTAIPVAHNDVYEATSPLQVVELGDSGGTCGLAADACDCCDSWGLVASAEVAFLKYGRADGVRVGVAAPGEDVDADYEPTPRVMLGWLSQSGLGARVRYWEFDQQMPANEGGVSSLNVDTYVIDLELFETFALNDNWDLEIAGGLRYNDFNEHMQDDGDIRINDFHALGGVASAEFRRLVLHRGALFARARGGLLVDDKSIFNNDTAPIQDVLLNDVTVGMAELALGYDYNIPLRNGACAFLRADVEWQNWYNYSSSFVDTTNSERFGGASDVSFRGFGLGLGIMR